MKNPSLPALVLALFGSASLLAQGPIAPTGPPGATMKSLAQIEPRTPIPTTGPFPYTISAPGSYYLTGNVTVATGDAIVISANDVTLDLAGFTIASTSPTLSGKAILLLGSLRTNISISNGFIRGTSVYNVGANNVTGGGFAEGIGGDPAVFGGPEGSAGPTAVRVASLGISGLGDAIRLNPASASNVVTGTTVSNVQGVGIRAGAVSDSTADRTGGVAIDARTVTNVAGSRYTAGTAVLPAPVAPLARTDLDARIVIPAGTATYTISAAGSYVLMGNITVTTGNGITIAADDVTLDLNGFSIASTAAVATGDAISLSGTRARIAISNGHIRSGVTYGGGAFSNGPGFANGINWPANQPSGVRVEDVSVTGVKSYGIDIGTDLSGVVQACTVRTAGNIGIRAGVVSDCAVTQGSSATITAGRVANSLGARADGTGSGITATSSSLDSVVAAVATAEARTPIPASVSNIPGATPITLPYTISQPGSYYLTGNITATNDINVLTIAASEVTLDLNGFTIAGPAIPASSLAVIRVNASVINCTIRNGMLSDGAYGIYDVGPSSGHRFENLTISDCFIGGVRFNGASVGAVVLSCNIKNIRNSSVAGSGAVGIYSAGGVTTRSCAIDNVVTISAGFSYGILGTNSFHLGNTIRNCTVGIRDGKYADNLTENCTVPFSLGTDAGGNN